MDTFTNLQDKFGTGDVALGGDARTLSPTVIEVFGSLGLDYVWLDYEHAGPTPTDSHHIEQLCRAATAVEIEPVVRLPSGDPKLVSKVLDTGVRSVIVPEITTADEVRRIVSTTQFPSPEADGDRGIGLVRANVWGEKMDDYIRRENSSVTVGVMIETQQAIENISEIVSVDGLDFVFVGPADLSLSMEGEYKPNASAVTDAVATAVNKANSAGTPVGRSVGSSADANEAIQEGYQMLTVGRDISLIKNMLRPRLDGVR